MISNVVISRFDNCDEYVSIAYVFINDLGDEESMEDLVAVRQMSNHILKLFEIPVLNVTRRDELEKATDT